MHSMLFECIRSTNMTTKLAVQCIRLVDGLEYKVVKM